MKYEHEVNMPADGGVCSPADVRQWNLNKVSVKRIFL